MCNESVSQPARGENKVILSATIKKGNKRNEKKRGEGGSKGGRK